MRLSFVDIAALPDAGVEGPNGIGAKGAPDDGFVGALRDVSWGRGQAGRHSEVHQEAAAQPSGSKAIDKPLTLILSPEGRGKGEGAAESKEGMISFPEGIGDEESPLACLSAATAMHWQAAVPLLNAIEKAPDEDVSGPVSGSSMPVNQSLPATFEDHAGMPLTPSLLPAGAGLILSPEGRGKGEGGALGMDISAEEFIAIPEIETTDFDASSFKDAGANAPDMPARPETSMSSVAASSPAYQAGDVKVIAEAHGHETMAGGLERKAGDSPITAEGQTLGSHPYISNLSGMDSANGSGYNPEDNGTGADRDKAVGDIANVSGSGAPAFSPLNEAGDYGNDPAPDAKRAAGTEGADGIYQRIEDAVSSIQSKAVRSIRLRLHPENMGEMSLRLIESDSVVSARITVTSPVVKDLLDADSSRLRNIFLAEGISLGKCSVELSSNFSSNDSRGFMWAWDNNGHGRGASALQARPVASRGIENGLTGAYNSFPAGRGGIDVFV